MKELNFGHLSGRQLCLRLDAPRSFRAMFHRSAWSFWWVLHRNANHRCWCPSGTMFDGRLCVAGFNVTWFYSRFAGDAPCVCDQA